MDFIINILASWGPMLFLIAVWIVFVTKSGQMQYGEDVETSLAQMNEHIEQTKRLNEKLDVIMSNIKEEQQS